MGMFSYSFSPLPDPMKVGRYCSISTGLKILDSHHNYDRLTTSALFFRPNNLLFEDIIGDAITQREEKNLKELLFKTINIEKTYSEFINLEDFDQSTYIQELYSISGSILGIADFLKYKK